MGLRVLLLVCRRQGLDELGAELRQQLLVLVERTLIEAEPLLKVPPHALLGDGVRVLLEVAFMLVEGLFDSFRTQAGHVQICGVLSERQLVAHSSKGTNSDFDDAMPWRAQTVLQIIPVQMAGTAKH
uniref:Uncharacterized protein n=1 Tax=Tetraselmis sp. GSL018 TaxID=582737 RepID=A0A061RZY3_9CHLO